jgi:purine nucleoside permease
VTFARFAVQVALQYEFDTREKPADFPTGYFPQGSTSPGQYPQELYGTEVFTVNDDLRQLAIQMAKQVPLYDDTDCQQYRANYANYSLFAPGAAPPTILACDTATADTYWSGDLLGSAFENTTRLFTNGTGVYCTTQQEDNATLEALLRGALMNLVDFSRIIIMRAASDFDRPFVGQTVTDNLFIGCGGYPASLMNLRIAGVRVVTGIVSEWDDKFVKGVEAASYVGDIFGSLGGHPSFGPGSVFGGKMAPSKRSLRWKRARLYVVSCLTV